MFIVITTYLKELPLVDVHLEAHREHLALGYQKNYFLCSGPKNPRTGGIILSQLHDRKILEAFLALDPFCLEGIASYEIIEFNPVQSHPEFKILLDK